MRYETPCARCRTPIRPGERGVRPYGKPVWHSACYGRYAEAKGIPMKVRLTVR